MMESTLETQSQSTLPDGPFHSAPPSDFKDEFQAMYTPLSKVVQKRPVTVPPMATLRESMQTMDRQRVGSVVITDPENNRPLGIFTLQDVLRRVALRQQDLDAPISSIMSGKLVTVRNTALAYDAAILMARRGIRHILVVNDDQELVGIVSKTDLFDLQRSGVREISQEICDAPDLPGLRQLADRVRSTGMTMIAQGVSAGPLTYFLSSLNDLLTIRVMELVAGQFELPKVRWCWLAFGSEGRFEQTFSTDQDNGLVFEVPKGMSADAIRAQFLPFCQSVNQRLDACGFTLCKGNIMAGNPSWCLSVDEWKGKFSQWVRVPEPEALLNATIFFDFRPLHGDHALAQDMWDHLTGLARQHPVFLHMMAKNALDVEPPIGFLRDFVTADTKGHEGTIDLKKAGVRLFVDAARIFSLATGLWQTNTAYRLRHGAPRLGMSEEDLNGIIQGLYYIQRIRLRNQCREIEEGVEPTNYVDPDALNEIDRKVLKESFKQAKKLQNRLKLDYHL